MSAADTARGQVAEQLRLDNPGWQVLDYPAPVPAELRKPRAVVFRTDLTPGDAGTLKHELTVQLYGLGGAQGATSAAELELDDVLDAALLSLQRLDGVSFEKATRSTFGDAFNGWELTLSVISQDIYRTAVQAERDTNGA